MGTVGMLYFVGDFRFYYSCGNIWSPQCWLNLTSTNIQTHSQTNAIEKLFICHNTWVNKTTFMILCLLSLFCLSETALVFTVPCCLLVHTHTYVKDSLKCWGGCWLTTSVIWRFMREHWEFSVMFALDCNKLHSISSWRHNFTVFHKHNPKGNKNYNGNICMRLKKEQLETFS